MFPIGTDHEGRRPAIAVVLLIVANVLAFVAMRNGWGVGSAAAGDGLPPLEAFLHRYMFQPKDLRWWQPFTALFVHSPDSPWHLAGNMLFLWVFGKPVESHVGFWRFLLLYVAGGLAAWLGHWAFSPNPALGASGAISAITGVFVVLFPRSHTRFFVFFGMTVVAIPSIWMVGIYAALDVYRLLGDVAGFDRSQVAAAAHLAGLGFGIGSGLLLLWSGAVPRGEWDLLYSIKQWRRRRELRSALRQPGPSPWANDIAAVRQPPPKPAPSPSVAPPPRPEPTTDAADIAQLRSAIQAALRAGNVDAAFTGYRTLELREARTSLPAEAQLDLANRALAAGDANLAGRAYERFLGTFPRHPKANEVRLLLAVVFVRRLGEPAKARPLLDGLAERLADPGQRELASSLSAEVGP